MKTKVLTRMRESEKYGGERRTAVELSKPWMAGR